MSTTLRGRSKGLSPAVLMLAWKAQLRLCARFAHLSHSGRADQHDAGVARHQPQTAVRGFGRNTAGGQCEHLSDLLLCELARLPRTRQVREAGEPALLVASALLKDDWCRQAQTFTDLRWRQCRIQIQQNPRTLRQTLIERRLEQPCLKFRAIRPTR